MEKGTQVRVSGEAVEDETNGNSTATSGVITSEVTIEEVVGYNPQQFNYFYDVKLSDGVKIKVNAHEIKEVL